MKAQAMRFTMQVVRDGVSYDVVVIGQYTPARPGFYTWNGMVPPEPSEFYFESIFYDGPYGASADLSDAEFEAADKLAGENYAKGIYDDRYDVPGTEGSFRTRRERDVDHIKRLWKTDEVE